MASGIRPPGRTNLPVPLSKPGLNEMTDSQNNSRIAPPQPVSNLLKHKASESRKHSTVHQSLHIDKHSVAEPPSKQRKTAEHSGFKRPASAQAMARPAPPTSQQIRPPSRLINGSSHSSSSRLAASTSSFRTISTQNGYHRPLSQSSNLLPRGHVRSKSQIAGHRQLHNGQDQSGAGQQQASNGMKPFIISTFSQDVPKQVSRCSSLEMPYKVNSLSKHNVSQRSCSEPLYQHAFSLPSVTESQNEIPEDSCLYSVHQTHLESPHLQNSLEIRHRLPTDFKQTRCALPRLNSHVAPTNHVSRYSQSLQSPKRPRRRNGTRIPIPSPEKHDQDKHDILPPSPPKTVGKGKSPQKGLGQLSSPTKTLFLSKDSNLTHPDWNDNGLETRMASVEGMFHALKGVMEGTTFEKSSTKELIDMMKMRSRFS
jgi:hypothetical protein